MTDPNYILLICDEKTDRWPRVAAAALAPLGQLQIVSVNEALTFIQQQLHLLIIVDAACVDDVPMLVQRIRALRPGSRVVIVTASPTWRRAREAFEAGAIDYIRKSLSQEELWVDFSDALKKTPLA